MEGPDHHRKVELQSPADLSYLYSNTVALSRQKLDLYFPPSATASATDGQDADVSDPLKEKVKELVENFILRTFTSATPSLSINGLDVTADGDDGDGNKANGQKGKDSSAHFSFKTQSAIEYEPYDSRLASRVTALYQQIEALTTEVAKLRREVPRKAALDYAGKVEAMLSAEDAAFQAKMREDEDKDEDEDVNMDTMPTNKEETTSSGAQNGDAAEQGQGNNNNASAPALPETHLRRSTRIREKQQRIRPEWKIQVPFENPTQQERWDSGDVAAVYSRALETLRQLHGDFDRKDGGLSDEEDEDSKALATTIGKLERAGKAVRVVEQLAGHSSS